MTQRLPDRLRARAIIRRQAAGRKSVEEGRPDRLADQLDEAANRIDALEGALQRLIDMQTDRYACASAYNLAFEEARKIVSAD